MLLYSDKITNGNIHACTSKRVYADVWQATRNARKVSLFRFDPSPEGAGRRNTGFSGAEVYSGADYAATYDEHGRWFARLFDIDPNARIGQYDGWADFHEKTGGHYVFADTARHLAAGSAPLNRIEGDLERT